MPFAGKIVEMATSSSGMVDHHHANAVTGEDQIIPAICSRLEILERFGGALY